VRDPATGQERWKEQRRWVSFPTYREAREHLSSLRQQAHEGRLAKATQQKLGEFLLDWLENHKRVLSEKAAYDYQSTIEAHILPSLLAAVPLKSVSPVDIDTYLREKAKEVNPRTKQPLSVRSLILHLTLLHTALEDAVKKGYRTWNPVDAVTRPKRRRVEIKTLDEEQLRVFLGTAKRTSRYYRLYLTAALTGMRQSELCGLKWENVDLLTGRIAVQTVFYRLAGRQIWKEPKSTSSRRSVPISPELAEELLTLKREQDAWRKELGTEYHDHGLAFAQDNGRPLHAHNIVRRDFRRVLKAAFAKVDRSTDPPTVDETTVPKITFHSLRHSFASLLVRYGTHMKVVQSLLGHSSVSISMDLYSHLQPAQRDEAIRTASERLLPARSATESANETLSTGRESTGRGGKATARSTGKPQGNGTL
jgi:integrase